MNIPEILARVTYCFEGRGGGTNLPAMAMYWVPPDVTVTVMGEPSSASLSSTSFDDDSAAAASSASRAATAAAAASEAADSCCPPD